MSEQNIFETLWLVQQKVDCVGNISELKFATAIRRGYGRKWRITTTTAKSKYGLHEFQERVTVAH